LQSAFWVTLAGLSYSAYRTQGYTDLGRQAVILIFPVVLSLSQLDLKKYRDPLLLGFSLCCTLTVLYLYYDAVHIIRFYKLPFGTLFSRQFNNHNFSDTIGMHATFLALQVAVALVYLLTTAIKNKTHRLFYSLCCFVLLAGLLQLSSKSVCATVWMIVVLVVPFFMLQGKQRLRFILVGLTITTAGLGLLSRSATFKERYYNALKEDLSQAKATETIDPRLARWGVAGQLVKQSPVIGHGSGSEIPLLKESYYSHKLYNSYLHGLNAHNQYLSFLLKYGVVGLFVYLGALVYGFRQAVQCRDVILFGFLLLVAMVSLSENLLDVDKGTMFYGLFFSFFVWSASGEKVVRGDKYLRRMATPVPLESCYI
jgi:O-antigen ligase